MISTIKLLSPIGLLFLIAFVFAACDSAPQKELTDAQSALTAADDADADLYVSDLYQTAVDSMSAAQTEMEIQHGYSVLSRDYARTRSLLNFVQTTATAATGQVESHKDVVRLEATDLIALAETKLAEMETLVAKAPRGKDGAIALISIQTDTDLARTTLDDARSAMTAGQYLQARDLAQQSVAQMQSLVDEMTQVVSKTRA